MKTVCCAIAILFCTSVAQADVVLRAGIKNLTWELIDLDPSDGIFPQIDFVSVEQHTGGALWGDGANVVIARGDEQRTGYNTFAHVVTQGAVSSEGRVEGDDLGSFSAISTVVSTLDEVNTVRSFGGTAVANMRVKFSLSANTAIRVSAHSIIDAQSQLVLQPGGVSDLYAFSEIRVSRVNSGSSDSHGYSIQSGDDQSFSQQRVLNTTFNTFAAPEDELWLTASTYVDHRLIPEPAQWALLLSGICAVALMGRFKSRLRHWRSGQ